MTDVIPVQDIHDVLEWHEPELQLQLAMFMIGSVCGLDDETRDAAISDFWPNMEATSKGRRGRAEARLFVKSAIASRDEADVRWLHLIAELTQDLPKARSHVTAAEFCMWVAQDLDDDELSPLVARRIDTMLEVAHTSFTYAGLESLFRTLAVELASAKPAGVMKHLPTIAGVVTGFAGGWFGHLTAGSYGVKGGEWLLAQFNTVDDNIRAIARILVNLIIILDSSDPSILQHADRLEAYLLELCAVEQREVSSHRLDLASDTGAREQQLRVLNAAAGLVSRVRAAD